MTQRFGIIALEVYWPATFVSQIELGSCTVRSTPYCFLDPNSILRWLSVEKSDGCIGKYTIGLGQHKMAFCTEREDVHSLCLTGKKL
jgi:3-hydroxy-3-methylglutaryl CoA synthase